MKLFARIRNDFQTLTIFVNTLLTNASLKLTIFVKRFTLDAWQSSENVVYLTLSNLFSGMQGCNIIFLFKEAGSHEKHFASKGLPVFRK